MTTEPSTNPLAIIRTPLLFVGESPPAGAPDDFVPFDCDSGDRLARLLGLAGRDVLLEHTRRVNIFDVPTGVDGGPLWSDAHARATADVIATTLQPRVIVALGQRVAQAFGLPTDVHYVPHRRAIDAPKTPLSCDVYVVPHPSGRSTKLNTIDARREFRRALLVDLVHGCPRLTPFDFAISGRTRIDVPSAREILTDLAHVVCPMDPRAGACALRIAFTSSSQPQRSVANLAALFANCCGPAHIRDALRVVLIESSDGTPPRAAWGLSNKSDVPGDDLSRAVVPEPTFARSCALRWRELRGAT